MFWRKKQIISPTREVSPPVFDWGEDDIPRYPPFMKGLPVVPPSKLIETQKELLDRIANSTIATPEVFQKHYLAAIERFASFSHLLPASQSHHHRGAGGLLRHAIEVGLWALQSADRVLLKSAVSPLHRREMEPRWQLAVFLAAMCHDAGKPVTDLTVSNKDRTSTWHPIVEDLYDWAVKNGVKAYFLEWREGRGKQHTALSSLIAERIIGAESLAWIAEVDTDLVVWLMESLAGNPGPTNLIYDLVIKADQTSVERDLKTLGVAMAGYDLGVPVERHLIDIMRRLVREGVWLINLPGARLWNMDGHVYLVWPAAGEELARQIKEDGIPGIPRTPDGILDMLTDRGMAFLREEASPEERLWKIAPAVLAEKIPDIKLTAIRLRDEAMVSSVPLPNAPGRVIATTHTGDIKPETNVPMQQPNDSESSAEASSVAIPAQVAPNPSHPEHSKLAIVVGTKAMGKTDSLVSTPIQLSGAIGEALKALAQDIKANDKKFGHDAILNQEGHVFLRWPDAFSGYGLAPKIVLDQLTERGWLVIDPMSPLKRTIPQNFEDGAHNAVHLNLDISEVFLAHSGWSGSVRKPDMEAPQGHPQPVAVGGSVTREKKKTTPIGATSSKPAGLRDGELVNAGRASSKSIPTIDAMLTILRTLNVVPHDDGYCRVGKTEGLKLCKAAGLKVNHRILWTFDEMKSELLALEDGQIKFKP
jgi:conjugal transfer pilus assembly protein TraI